MPTYEITGPDGRKFKITGPNKEGALVALQAQMAGAAPQAGDTSMSTAFQVGDARTIAASKGYMADASRQMEQGPVGRFMQAGEDYIAKPISDALGIERGSRADAVAEEQARMDSEAQMAAQRRDSVINDTNYQSMTTGDVKGVGSLLKFGGQKIAESASGMAATIASGGTMALPMAAGEINENLRDIEGLSEEDRIRLATGGGAISAVLEKLGIGLLFKGIPNNVLGKMGVEGVSKVLERNGLGRFSKSVASGIATEGLTEAAQEGVSMGAEAIGGREFTSADVKSRLIEAAAAGAAAGGGLRGGASIAGGVVDTVKSKPREDTPEARAEATFAQRIQRTAERGDLNGTPFNLKDINTASQNGVRALIDATHKTLVGEMASDAKVLRDLLKPNDTDSFDAAFGKVQAQVGLEMARNKTKSVVTKDNFDALEAIVGNTSEGQNLLNLVRESQVLTKIHNDGYKGGVSQYTDAALPFDGAQNTYNSAAQIARTTLGPMGAVYAGVATGGTSIPIQAAVGLGGRGIDKITGRRSRLNRFVKQNANRPGIETPSGLPSIKQDRIDQAKAAQLAEEAKAADAAARTEALKQTNLNFVKEGAGPTEGSPQDIVEAATGLDRSGVARILRVIQATNQDPIIQDAIQGYRSSVAVGGRVPDMSPLIRSIKQMAKKMGVREPDTGTTQAATGSRTQASPENYQRGIDDNKAKLQDLKDKAKTDPTMSPADKAKVLQALDQLGMNLGSDPGAKVNEIMGTLEGVESDAVAQFVEPYVMRVMGQQNAAQRNQLATPLFNDPLKIDGKVTVKAIGEALNQDHLDKHGQQFFPEQDEADYQQVLEFADQEMSEQLKQPNSGVGWYSKDVDTSMRLASKVFPTLATNLEHRRLYLTFAGIFSNGADPDNAFIMSSWAFDDFLRTGQIPINRAQGFIDQGLEPPKTTFLDSRTKKPVTKNAGWGIRNQANEQQLGMLKYLVETKGGLSAAMDFLLSPQDRTAINDVMLDSGLYKAGRFTTKSEKAGPPEHGFLAFGKKLGRYSMGLQGVDIDAGDTTIDLWYTRTFRRWTGRLLETPIGKEGVAAQPANDTERNAIFRLTGELAKKYSLPVGDVQALLWFFEKRTWGAQGLKTKEGTNSSGARKLLEQRGIPENDDPAGSNGPSVRNSQAPVTGGQPQIGGILSAGTNPPNNPVRSRAPEVPEVKQQTALVNASIEIGKPGSEFENGIKDMAGVEKLAAAYDIALKFYNSNPEMRQAVRGVSEKALGAYSPSERTANVVSTGDLQELIIALHETMHGVGIGNLATGNFLGETRTTNGLTGQSDVMGIGSLESVMDFVLGKGKSDPVRREILAELKHIQKRAVFSTAGVQAPIRGAKSMAMMLKNAKKQFEQDAKDFEASKAEVRQDLKDHQNYERSIGELTVDALQLYAHDPKTMKRVAPQTARMIRELFQKSGNKKIQFYNHPLAMAVAVAMAIMAKAGMEDEEKEKQQLPPGMLSPQPGMLTA